MVMRVKIFIMCMYTMVLTTLVMPFIFQPYEIRLNNEVISQGVVKDLGLVFAFYIIMSGSFIANFAGFMIEFTRKHKN